MHERWAGAVGWSCRAAARLHVLNTARTAHNEQSRSMRGVLPLPALLIEFPAALARSRSYAIKAQLSRCHPALPRGPRPRALPASRCHASRSRPITAPAGRDIDATRHAGARRPPQRPRALVTSSDGRQRPVEAARSKWGVENQHRSCRRGLRSDLPRPGRQGASRGPVGMAHAGGCGAPARQSRKSC